MPCCRDSKHLDRVIEGLSLFKAGFRAGRVQIKGLSISGLHPKGVLLLRAPVHTIVAPIWYLQKQMTICWQSSSLDYTNIRNIAALPGRVHTSLKEVSLKSGFCKASKRGAQTSGCAVSRLAVSRSCSMKFDSDHTCVLLFSIK